MSFRNEQVAAPLKAAAYNDVIRCRDAFRNEQVAAPLKVVFSI